MQDRDKAWHAVVEKETRHGFDSLWEVEKTWFCARLVIDAVENGGLISFYYNRNADYLKPCLEALARLRATEVIDAIQEVNKLFADGNVPADIEARNDIIDNWPEDVERDKRLDEIDAKLMPLMSELDTVLDRFLSDNGQT
jgi:hypothetical protein